MSAEGKSVRNCSGTGKMHAFRCERRDYLTHGVGEYPPPIRVLHAIVFFLIWLFCRIKWRTRFYGMDELVEHVRDRGSVIVMNHVSMIDPVATVVYLGMRGVTVRPIYKSEFDRIGPAKFFFPRMGAIPIERGSADINALRAAKDALGRGECVLIYPEGTRVKSDEQEVEIHGGFSMIAQMGRSDVVPAAIVGAADPYKTRPTRGKRPLVTFGRPITFESLGVKGRKAQMAEMERAAMAEVYRLRDELRVENPGLW